MCGTASAASGVLTVRRTISEPASASSLTWIAVPITSTVSVLVIDCTRTGASPPTVTTRSPQTTRAWRLRRAAGSPSGMGCSEVGSRAVMALLTYFRIAVATLPRVNGPRSKGSPRRVTCVTLAMPAFRRIGSVPSRPTTSPGSTVRDSSTAPLASRTSIHDSPVVRSTTVPATAGGALASADVGSGGAECTVSEVTTGWGATGADAGAAPDTGVEADIDGTTAAGSDTTTPDGAAALAASPGVAGASAAPDASADPEGQPIEPNIDRIGGANQNASASNSSSAGST